MFKRLMNAIREALNSRQEWDHGWDDAMSLCCANPFSVGQQGSDTAAILFIGGNPVGTSEYDRGFAQAVREFRIERKRKIMKDPV